MEGKIKVPNLVPIKSACCGCGVCALVCNLGAIRMLPDLEGFLYPVIDTEKCIGCNSCLNNCILKTRRLDVRSK